MQEVATMSQRTLGKVWKMEMLTKLGGVKKNKKCIFFLDFQKTKKHGALRNSISEGSMFFVFSKSKKNITNLIFLTPEPQEISTV